MNPLRQLRTVGLLEGISLLLLLGVAMPLKYGLDLPIAVRIAGPIHGLLFTWFVVQLFRVASELGWPARRSALVLVAAIGPWAPFALHRMLRRAEHAA